MQANAILSELIKQAIQDKYNISEKIIKINEHIKKLEARNNKWLYLFLWFEILFKFLFYYSFNGLFSFYYVVYYIIVIFLDMITKFIIALFLFTSILSLPNSAPYIKAKNRPLNIAHRGLCSILPENTM